MTITNRRIAWLVAVALACALVAVVVRPRSAAAPAEVSDPRGVESAGGGRLLAVSSPTNGAAALGAISGRVTDERGAAVGGASVCALGASPTLVTAETKNPHCVPTAADGRYRIEGLAPATYDVSASAAQLVPARWRDREREAAGLLLKPGESRQNVDMTLRHGGVEVRGTVKDISGGTISGAAVSVEATSSRATVVTQSDAKGEWHVWTAPGELTAHADADGYTAGSTNGTAPGQLIEILLTPESVLQGRVVEAGTDTPIAGARVSAGFVSVGAVLNGGGVVFNGGAQRSALSDAEGRFRIPALDPGRYKPEASAPRRWGAAQESVLLGLAETSREIVIELHVAPSVSGRIELEGKPCEDGSVSLKGKKTDDRRWAKSDADGKVRFEAVLAGAYQVSVSCPNAASREPYEAITVAGADVAGLVWKVDRGASASGVVVDATDHPVSGASVWARPSTKNDPRSQADWGQAETDAAGAFRIRGLLAATYAFEVRREGVVPLTEPVEVKVAGDVTGIRIVLPSGGGIEGVVVDTEGAPAPGLDVRARAGERWQWNYVSTRDDGSFAFKGLNTGDYRVQAEYRRTAVRAPGTKDDDVQGVAATVRAGEVTKVKLVVESQRGEIHGRVIDEAGGAVPDAFVEAEREIETAGAAAGRARREMQWQWGNLRSPVLTDVDGNFRVTSLSSPGTYTVRAFRKGGGETVAEGVPVGNAVTLTIRSEGSMAGTVSATNGKTPERFVVSLHDVNTGVSRKETFFRTSGAWSIRDLPAGDFDVSAEADGRGLTHVKLAQGEKREGVSLLIQANASVRGRVVALETGAPVAGMFVLATPAKGAAQSNFIMLEDEGERKNVSDADGRFELDNVAPGRVTIQVFANGGGDSDYTYAVVPATVESGKVNELPPIRVARKRVKGELTGDLGFGTRDREPGIDLAQTRSVVSTVRPGGPAAKAGLAVGDEITSVDGYDVVGVSGYLFGPLTRVAEGTGVKLGLRRGATLAVTAEKPR